MPETYGGNGRKWAPLRNGDVSIASEVFPGRHFPFLRVGVSTFRWQSWSEISIGHAVDLGINPALYNRFVLEHLREYIYSFLQLNSSSSFSSEWNDIECHGVSFFPRDFLMDRIVYVYIYMQLWIIVFKYIKEYSFIDLVFFFFFFRFCSFSWKRSSLIFLNYCFCFSTFLPCPFIIDGNGFSIPASSVYFFLFSLSVSLSASI